MRPRQLALDLAWRPAHGREDFLATPANSAALGWLDRWPDWPGGGLVIHGPSGCGKTHLAEIWQRIAGAGRMDMAAIGGADIARLAAQSLWLDNCDVDFDQVALLHLYNMLRENGQHLLLTARHPAVDWAITLADLRSRLKALPAVAIAAPDDRLLEAVLIKLAGDRRVRLAPKVVAYLMSRMPRSFAAADAVINALARAALAERRAMITVPMAGAVLQNYRQPQDRS